MSLGKESEREISFRAYNSKVNIWLLLGVRKGRSVGMI